MSHSSQLTKPPTCWLIPNLTKRKWLAPLPPLNASHVLGPPESFGPNVTLMDLETGATKRCLQSESDDFMNTSHDSFTTLAVLQNGRTQETRADILSATFSQFKGKRLHYATRLSEKRRLGCPGFSST